MSQIVLPPLAHGVSKEDVQRGCFVLERILTHILRTPSEAKYRSLNIQSTSWKTASGIFDGGDAALCSFFERHLNATGLENETPSSSTSSTTSSHLLLGDEGMTIDRLAPFLEACEAVLREVQRLRQAGESYLTLMVTSRPQSERPFSADGVLKSIREELLETKCIRCMEDWMWVRRRLVRLSEGVQSPLLLSEESDATASQPECSAECQAGMKRAMERIKAYFGSETITIPPSMILALEEEVVRLLFPAEISSTPEARKMAIERSRRRWREEERHQQEREAAKRVSCHPEVAETATRLISDIGGFIELYSMIVEPNSVVRRDRLEMKRLLQEFAEDGDLVKLHQMRDAWVQKLDEAKRASGKETLFL